VFTQARDYFSVEIVDLFGDPPQHATGVGQPRQRPPAERVADERSVARTC
jgi:hypothetical protein